MVSAGAAVDIRLLGGPEVWTVADAADDLVQRPAGQLCESCVLLDMSKNYILIILETMR